MDSFETDQKGFSFGTGGGLVVSKLLDYVVPFSWTPQGKLFKAQKAWQNELEEQRMNFQEKLEARRLRCQERIDEQRAELQKYLAEKGMKNNREIALFQARAMRQTQMLVAQENARNILHDHLLQDALRTFPLNVSPLVLLKNQSQSLGVPIVGLSAELLRAPWRTRHLGRASVRGGGGIPPASRGLEYIHRSRAHRFPDTQPEDIERPDLGHGLSTDREFLHVEL